MYVVCLIPATEPPDIMGLGWLDVGLPLGIQFARIFYVSGSILSTIYRLWLVDGLRCILPYNLYGMQHGVNARSSPYLSCGCDKIRKIINLMYHPIQNI